ncbi:Protein Churchill [Desmophyllum pertusum]|uniref:Protein Churchill n=1 Tax=Desmophyllum pertusum TaxID=174260 RepID=A0A9W9YXA5_9CNID|nr:Protein Churchill [Desmophyllum pertusum]
MCRDCVKVQHPERGTICLESGCYLLNFACCKACGTKEPLKITEKYSQEDSEGEELVTYKHVCPTCDHLVAEHEYTFRVEGKYQEYMMTCLLCGRAADSVSILPDNPATNIDNFF